MLSSASQLLTSWLAFRPSVMIAETVPNYAKISRAVGGKTIRMSQLSGHPGVSINLRFRKSFLSTESYQFYMLPRRMHSLRGFRACESFRRKNQSPTLTCFRGSKISLKNVRRWQREIKCYGNSLQKLRGAASL